MEFSIWACSLSWSGAPTPNYSFAHFFGVKRLTTGSRSSPALPLPGCVTLGRSPLFSESQALKKWK